MTQRAKRLVAAGAACACVAFGAFAYVRADDEPTGYLGKGQVVVHTSLGGAGTITIGGDVAMEERGSRIRVDVLSLAIPGSSVSIATLLATQLFPPGGFSIVYDRRDSSFTVWSASKPRFYSTASATPQPPAQALPGAGASNGGDLLGIFSFAKSLKNDSALSVSLGLAGHQIVNGHPATGLNFQYARTTNDNDSIDVHGTLQFADDLDGLPVEITVDGKSRSFPESAFRLDFSSLAKGAPPDADFVPPPGYARVASIGDVIGKTLSIPGGQ